MTRRECLAILPMALRAGTEDGFVPLFDGKSLAGWQVIDGPESAFYVQDDAIVISESANFPTWLRSARQYENFDFRCEFYLKGWMNSGIYLHAAEHGPPTATGMKIAIFQKQEKIMRPESMGAIFPLVAPKAIDIHNQGEWNEMRVLMDWPQLRVWTNGTVIQDLNLESVPELRWRLRRGFLGIESLSYANRFRNLRIRELPSRQTWESLYEQPEDLVKWEKLEGQATWETLGGVLRSDGLGYLGTRERYSDFELQLYVRASKHSNGGVEFRAQDPVGKGDHYEIQIHDVEGATYATGSLYGYRRAKYPRIEPEQWYLMQVVASGPHCLVRVNGETVVEYHELENRQPGRILLQAHQRGKWLEYKHIRIRRLDSQTAV